MYVPGHFAQSDDEAWAVVTDAGAGTLVHGSHEGLASVFVPVVVADDRTTLRAHVARANGWWRDLNDGDDVLGVFVAASAYVSPSYYPSLHEGVDHVPTWNYVLAEVRGRVRVCEDPQWLRTHVAALSEVFESSRDPRWTLEMSSAEYLDRQLRAIVGIEIDVTSIQGKAKLSQNRLAGDRAKVRARLSAGTAMEQVTARWMR